MRILRVIASMDPASGGPCQGIRNSIPALKKLGVENEVVCLDAPDAPFIGSDPFPVTALGPHKTPWQYSSLLLPWLQKNLGRFDAVIAHGLWLYTSYAAGKAVTLYRRQNPSKKAPAFFVMPHGMLDPYFQKAGTRKLKALRNVLYWQFIESRVVNNADAVLFTCQAELELARIPFKPYHPEAELNVGYGIPAPKAFNASMKKAFEEVCPGLNNRSYLLFLSRIHEKKGTDILIKAYERVCLSGHKDLPALVIAGPGMETDYGKQLGQLVNESDLLRENVFFPGMLSGDHKWGAFYGCEAFVLPSHQENFGIAVVEALACGKPVLISNQVNIWHEIKNAGAGLVDDDDAEGTYRLLDAFVNMPVIEKQTMKLNALTCYHTHFSIEKAAQKLNDQLSRYA